MMGQWVKCDNPKTLKRALKWSRLAICVVLQGRIPWHASCPLDPQNQTASLPLWVSVTADHSQLRKELMMRLFSVKIGVTLALTSLLILAGH
jgi:hypothetical protein